MTTPTNPARGESFAARLQGPDPAVALDLFLGRQMATIDAARRLYLPAQFAKVVEGAKNDAERRLMVGHPVTKPCIWIITAPLIKDLEKRYRNRAAYDPFREDDQDDYMRHALGGYQEEALVKGRLPLPDYALRHAHLDPKEILGDENAEGSIRALVVGNGEKLEIWQPRLFEENLRAAQQSPQFVERTRGGFQTLPSRLDLDAAS